MEIGIMEVTADQYWGIPQGFATTHTKRVVKYLMTIFAEFPFVLFK
jgi:hypothetical protein